MSFAWDSGNIPPFHNESSRIPGFNTWKWVGLCGFGFCLFIYLVFVWGGKAEEGRDGLYNQYFHLDNSYLIFNQKKST